MALIFTILIWVLVVGGAVAIVNALDLDPTIKRIGRLVILIVAAVIAIQWLRHVLPH